MICPKCKKEICIGMLGPGGKGSLFWAEDGYFKNKTANFFTEKMPLNVEQFIFR